MSSWISTARLVINIPDLNSYEDTLQVVGHLSTQLSWCYVLTVAGQSSFESYQKRWPRLSLIELPRRSFPKYAARWVTQRAKANGIEIIHDFFGHLARFCERTHLPNRSYIMVHTQRTTNWGWFERVRPLRYQIDKRYASQRARSLWYDTRIVHAVDHVTVMGPGHEKDLIEGHQLSPHKISFIPSETDCSRFKPLENLENLENPDSESSSKNQTLLYVGALVRAKGLELLLELFTHLGQERDELTLTLIGRETPFERHWLHSQLAQHPLKSRINLISFQPREKLIQAYQQATLFMFPSLFEGSPRALREAVACGLPAVVSEIPGHRGIDPQGVFLWFVPPHDVGAWLKTTRIALDESDNQKQARGKRGSLHLQNHHDPQAVANQWAQLYEHIARQHGLSQT